jgi:hypothetical protein
VSIIHGLTNSFKTQLLSGQHDLSSDVLKIALYSSLAELGPQTTAYSATAEVTGTGYSAGGATLSGAAISISNGVAFVDFSDVSWANSSITARGALIYNASKSNKSVMVLNFGIDRASSGSTFQVKFPTANKDSALIRIGG